MFEYQCYLLATFTHTHRGRCCSIVPVDWGEGDGECIHPSDIRERGCKGWDGMGLKAATYAILCSPWQKRGGRVEGLCKYEACILFSPRVWWATLGLMGSYILTAKPPSSLRIKDFRSQEEEGSHTPHIADQPVPHRSFHATKTKLRKWGGKMRTTVHHHTCPRPPPPSKPIAVTASCRWQNHLHRLCRMYASFLSTLCLYPTNPFQDIIVFSISHSLTVIQLGSPSHPPRPPYHHGMQQAAGWQIAIDQ